MTHLVFLFCYLPFLCFYSHLEAVLSTFKIRGFTNTYFLLLVQLNKGGSFRRLATKLAVRSNNSDFTYAKHTHALPFGPNLRENGTLILEYFLNPPPFSKTELAEVFY